MSRLTRLMPVFCAAIAFIAGSADAERWIVPAGAHATGAQDTNWRTDLQLVNPTHRDVTVGVFLLRKGVDNSDLGGSSSHTVAAGGQVVIGDVFASDFGYSGTGGLLIECDDPALVVTSRTYNLLDDTSTYGQFIPGVRRGDALAAGQQGEIIYLAKSDDFRSNLGFCAASADGGTFTVRLYDETGAQTGTVSRDFDGFEQWQINDVFNATGAPPSTTTRAEVEATAPIVAYGSVVDERTGDPVAVMAERIADAAFSASAIAASARASGAEDSLWRTDIRVYNPSSGLVTVTLDYYRKNTTNGPQDTASFSIEAGATLAMDDAMMEAFGLASANGGIRIIADAPVMAWSRTYNQSDTGTFGQSIPAVSQEFSLGSSERLIYTGLSNTGFRSNLGFFNLEPTDATVPVFLFDESGIESSKLFTVGPNQMTQIDDVFDWLEVDDTGGFYSLWVGGESDLIAYVSVIDNLSNDPVYQPGEVRTIGGGGAACVTLPEIPADTVTTHDISGLEEFLDQLLPYDGDHQTTYGETTDTTNTIDVRDDLTVTFGGSTVDATAEATLEFDFQIADDPPGLPAVERDSNHLEYTFLGSTTITDTVRTYDPAKIDPALVSGPSITWCEGMTWTAASVSVITQIDDEPPEQSASAAEHGEVLSVSEEISVPAGSFTTVWYRVTTTSGDAAGATNTLWLDVDTGVIVKQEMRDPIGLLTLYLALTDLQ